uniref:Uncharacterized protein n=1 Tax=Staphylococcus aureus TaxID=1280 RepID=A0A0P0UWQ4_STAAU|nr:hypothetical protein [Staphylococcus aureus]
MHSIKSECSLRRRWRYLVFTIQNKHYFKNRRCVLFRNIRFWSECQQSYYNNYGVEIMKITVNDKNEVIGYVNTGGLRNSLDVDDNNVPIKFKEEFEPRKFVFTNGEI